MQEYFCSLSEVGILFINYPMVEAYKHVKALEKALDGSKKATNAEKLAVDYKNKVIPVMEKLRIAADKLESLVAKPAWPIPTYGDLLFGI